MRHFPISTVSVGDGMDSGPDAPPPNRPAQAMRPLLPFR
jgi:hypothetical protein